MPHIVRSDSVLATTAAELLARHSADSDSGGICTACGWPAPCPAARHADLVLAAAPVPAAEPLHAAA
ncbi:hypothetical protein [Dactylosporangium sp. CS-033363]|uniref:hypothetical protein n=1 Tax=Dactylosporangium sp. CS-033363 TaxID=3239935 RepID=UPI003D93501B